MTAPEWTVVEFDAEQAPLWGHGPYDDEGEARARFVHVTAERHQHPRVLQRARSAALLRDGAVVEACSIAASSRAPWIGDKRLRHLEPETRDRIASLELLGVRLAQLALRVDGRPRRGPLWAGVRSVAVSLWETVRGVDTVPTRRSGSGWWLVEWVCGDTEVARDLRLVPQLCPYHAAVRAFPGPVLVEGP